jgi:lipopolysaccharide cholinephosphotransferase
MPLKTALTQAQINILYEILEKFDQACTRAKLPYFMGGGTALGAVRHGGLIPWDDDGDLYMLAPEFHSSSIQLYYEATKLGLHIRPMKVSRKYDSENWYKIYLGEHAIPNVDLFLMKWESTCWKLADPSAAKWWPKELLTQDQILHAYRIPFGPLQLPIFGTPDTYLTRTYGEDWNKVAWDGYDHVNEKERPPRANVRAVDTYEPALPTIRTYSHHST